MGVAANNFEENVQYVWHLGGLERSLKGILTTAVDLTDLLRAQIVFAVSAIDALTHDILVETTVQMHQGRRTSGDLYGDVATRLRQEGRSVTVAAVQFEVQRRFGSRTLQRVGPIERALGLVGCDLDWAELEQELGMDADSIRRYLGVIVDRRNRICHAADRDPVDAARRLPLNAADVENAARFIEVFGTCLLRQAGLVEVPSEAPA